MIILTAYLLIFLGVGFYDYFRVKNFDDYVVAGRRQNQLFLTMSMLATMIGASATMGIASLAADRGALAFLWLGSGAIGLVLQSRFLSEKIRNLNVYTLPGLAEECAGKEGKYITAVVIVISWTGIIAAQFTALSGIASIITGLEPSKILIISCSSVIILYTAFGGQLSIIKTDALQLLLLAAGLLTAFYAAGTAAFPAAQAAQAAQAAASSAAAVSSVAADSTAAAVSSAAAAAESVLSRLIQLKPLSPVKVLHLLFIVGGAYFVGPDIFSRNFTSNSAETARKATYKAGFFLFAFSIVITLTGTFVSALEPDNQLNPYIYIIKNLSTPAMVIIISAGLLSAIISSTDTCIITAAAIIEKDLIGKKNLAMTRIITVITGITALAIALFKRDILSLLLGTYSVFSPGIVFPVFTAVYFMGKRKINKKLWLTAVITGSAMGIISAASGIELFALAGMGFSVIISLLSAGRKPTGTTIR